MKIVEQIIRYSEGVLGLKSNDIILVSFPKSGNTWVRFFLCNLISIAEWNGRVVDFCAVDSTMPAFGIHNLLKSWHHSIIPRFVKTHRRHSPIFNGKRSILVVRDPRDTMVSYFRFETARKRPRFIGDFSAFIRHKKFGLPAWLSHFNSWLSKADIVISYEKLRNDDVREFGRMLDGVGVHISNELIKEAAVRAKFEQVREIEQKYGLSKPNLFKADYNFVRQGKTGNWRDYFSEENIVYYKTLSKLFTADLDKFGYLNE